MFSLYGCLVILYSAATFAVGIGVCGVRGSGVGRVVVVSVGVVGVVGVVGSTTGSTGVGVCSVIGVISVVWTGSWTGSVMVTVPSNPLEPSCISPARGSESDEPEARESNGPPCKSLATAATLTLAIKRKENIKEKTLFVFI